MKQILLLFTAFIFLQATCDRISTSEKRAKSVLVYSKTTGFRHESIPAGIAAIKKLGLENGFQVTASEDSTMFVAEKLQNINVVIFLNTTGNVLNTEQEAAFQKYIKNGGGFVGIHAATDTEYEWEWYGRMVGGYFKSHPHQQNAKLLVVSQKHPATAHLPTTWLRFDEWYNYKNLNPNVNVLIKLDETSYKGGENGENHPIAWYHNFEGGRIFQTGLGHTVESYSEPMFLQHILGGIKYAGGWKK